LLLKAVLLDEREQGGWQDDSQLLEEFKAYLESSYTAEFLTLHEKITSFKQLAVANSKGTLPHFQKFKPGGIFKSHTDFTIEIREAAQSIGAFLGIGGDPHVTIERRTLTQIQ